MSREVDIVDVHVTSQENVVDAFSQYPLLDGDKNYTVEVTEFVCSLAGQGPLQSSDLPFFTVYRKNHHGTHGNEPSTSLTTLPAPLGDPQKGAAGHDYVPGKFIDDNVQFKKNEQRPMQTPGDLAYQCQRFFDDLKSKYIVTDVNGLNDITADIENQEIIIADPNSTAGEILDAQEAIAAHLDGYRALGAFDASLHGGGEFFSFNVVDDTKFVTVQIAANGVLKLFLHPFFTKHFYIRLTSQGAFLLAHGKDDLLAFRTVGGNVVQGLQALTNNAAGNAILAGEVTQTVELPGSYSLERHFDHRVRLEIESQMGTPATVAWTTTGSQRMSHIIATFPVTTKTETSIECNSEGSATGNIRYQTDVLLGDITWRNAEMKVSERYKINNPKHFYNIRLEIFMVRKEWFEADKSFIFAKEKMSFESGESWTAKLRFRSI